MTALPELREELLARLRKAAMPLNQPMRSISLLNEAANAIEYLSAALEAQEWQPIETAPKNGTGILLSNPDLGIKRPVPEHHQQWFETLTRAFKEGNVALMTCGSPNGVRTVICMVNHQHDDGAEFIPVGEMCEADNPFEHYIPPSKDEEDDS